MIVSAISFASVEQLKLLWHLWRPTLPRVSCPRREFMSTLFQGYDQLCIQRDPSTVRRAGCGTRATFHRDKAVADAIGIRINEIPLSPERVLKAIQARP